MSGLHIKHATPDDSASLAILADMATRRLASFLWAQGTGVGQSPFEMGRSVIRDNPNSLLHHSHWLIAERSGRVVGGLNGYILNEFALAAPAMSAAAVVAPLDELKTLVLGSWYVSALAVFPEARGQQVAQSLLHSAEQSARAVSANDITLMVGSFNINARRLYEKMGYEERAQRDFVSFMNSDRGGHWVLMAKSLRGAFD